MGAATVGLLIRDTVNAATGVPLPIRGSSHPWLDRAGLIEESWADAIDAPDNEVADDISSSDGLATPWLERRTSWSEWGPAGALVLNSVSATTKCRVLLSQMSLPTEGARSGCVPSTHVPNSADLAACAPKLSSVTVALLASRFPFVTPGGAIECPTGQQDEEGNDEQVQLQIVDGGYAEYTGLGTLLDLAPSLTDLIRDHNDCVLAAVVPKPRCATDDRFLVLPSWSTSTTGRVRTSPKNLRSRCSNRSCHR